MTVEIAGLTAKFQTNYGRAPIGFVRAPGRVSLMGGAVDYNEGFVLPMAIERETVAAFAPRKDRLINLSSRQAEEHEASFALDDEIAPGEPTWANYCKGVAAGLRSRGTRLVGMDILFDTSLPLGGGLSSSAALEVATALAMLRASGETMEDYELARLCQKAEHEFANSPCGIMDQTICIMGQKGHALLLDCRDGSVKHVPFDDLSVVVLVADTQVRHSIAEGGYASRRAQCFSAAKKLGVKALRDADEEMLDAAARDGVLADIELMRARHVVPEIRRTVDAAGALAARDYTRFGKVMLTSHASLRDNYETSCDELDSVVELACSCEGAYGARVSGGGFGGCVVILADAGKAEAISQTIASGFFRKFGRPCPIFPTRAAPGAAVLD
ncbi:MAG: galactokinase [bacterium]|nr:galactokinase [bacterium]